MYDNKIFESKPNQDMIIYSLLTKLKEKKLTTDEHLKWLENFITKIGESMNMKNSDILDLNNSILIHELSKVTIPDNILMKEGGLDSDEIKIMKKHSEAGFRIARALNSYLHLSDIVFSLHEWWNGSGYPKGLKENDISQLSRLLAIFIAYDAMIHDLPYRKAFSQDEAVNELRSNEGKQFDPNLTELFIHALDSQKKAA
jgi:HD-GYP domain-containing protein (c-di-GMP phosphodiesterase class II)